MNSTYFSYISETRDATDAEALAKLIADSTEKKFKINSLFKGMWKKKHYSFDLSWVLWPQDSTSNLPACVLLFLLDCLTSFCFL